MFHIYNIYVFHNLKFDQTIDTHSLDIESVEYVEEIIKLEKNYLISYKGKF